MSIPAIRAMRSLPLPLLVLRVRADDHHGAVTAHDLAVVAAGLDRRSDFQRALLSHAVRDPTAGQVVGRKLDPDAVAGQDPDEVHPQLPGDMRSEEHTSELQS